MRSEVRAGRRKSVHVPCGLVAAQADRCARGAGSDQGWRGQGTSGAHPEHAGHVRDRGGVEDAERLVE